MSRRKLTFDQLSEAVEEARALLDAGYQRQGNWSLGQICRHMRLTIDASRTGYPGWMSLAAPIRPLLRWLALPKLISGNSPAGLITAGIFVPPGDLDDRIEVEQLVDSVAQFHAHEGPFYPHPGFGRLDRKRLEHFHAMHAAHHLGFLIPGVTSGTDANDGR